MSYLLSPFFNEPQVDANGDPVAGGQIETYLSGTLTPTVTYKTSSGTAHTNPIILDAAGYYPTGTQLYLENGRVYKFIFKDAVGATLRTIDNVTAINDVISSPSEWVQYGLSAFSYLSANSFSVVGDQTGIFQVGRRIQTTNTGGTSYGSVLTSVYGAPNTTVTLTNTSGSLDAGLSAIFYALISTVNSSLPIATDTVSGIVELATSAEAIAGTDTTHVLTPATMKASQIVLGARTTLTTQTFVDFQSIPSWAKRVSVFFASVSTNGTSTIIAQIGPSGGIETSGYLGTAATVGNAIATSAINSSAGYPVANTAATSVHHGTLTFSHMGSNQWVISGTLGRSDVAAASFFGGSKTLANTLTQVRITTATGADQFDSGVLSVSWE